MKPLFLGIAAFSCLFSAQSALALDVTFVGGINRANYSLDTAAVPSINYSTSGSSSEWGYAGLIQFGAWPGFGFETGLQYIPRHSMVDYGAGSTADVRYNSWMIPALLRVTALPVVSFGAGFYYMTGTGQVTTTGTGGVASSVADFDTTGPTGSHIGKSEWGTMFNVRAAYGLAALTSAVLDVRFDAGLTDRSADPAQATNMKFKDLLIQAGISFGI